MAAAHNYNLWLFNRARPHLGRSVLDIGAGIGTFTALAAEGRDRVLALEPDRAFAARLDKRFSETPSVQVLSMDATQLELDVPVGSIICFNVLEHIANDSLALKHFAELLEPDGRLLLLVPAHPRLFGAADRALGHERRYLKESLDSRLREAGFEIEELRYVNPVGALGWLVSSRLLGEKDIPGGPLRLYDLLVPLFRALDRLRLPFGLSLWAIARKPSER
jgi:SAM-dependent methyltransferase